jgi:hypothetical protein
MKAAECALPPISNIQPIVFMYDRIETKYPAKNALRA